VIGKDGPGEERVLRPEGAAIGPAQDKIKVQRDITEVVGRKNFQVGSLRINDPEESPQGGEAEDHEKDGVGNGHLLPRGARATGGGESGRHTKRHGNPCPAGLKSSGQGGESGRCDGRNGDKNETAAEDTPSDHSSLLLGRRSRAAFSIAP
jgi:hypothetical protein